MTLHTFKGFVDGARDAYLQAVEKHPKFTERLANHDLAEVREFLALCRKWNADPKRECFNSIIDEEIAEYCEATLLGDTEAAKRELLDCAAVIMREWERITQ